MTKLENLNIDCLPWLPLSFYKTFPKASGIYFVVDDESSVYYIGRSENINRRWLDHPQINNLRNLKNTKVAFLFLDSTFLNDVESKMIELFNPPLNKTISKLKTANVLPGITVKLIKEMSVENLGKKIRTARLNSNISTIGLCRELNISPTYYYAIENETINGTLHLELLRKIEEVLDTSFDLDMTQLTPIYKTKITE